MGMTGPDISIIIPFYRGLSHIEQTVNSARAINRSKEILIVDDGSEDGSFNRLRELFDADGEVRLMQKENGGIADARNFGLNAATGRYVFFMDQDDTAVAEVIEDAIEMADESLCDMVFWTTEMTYEARRANRECDTVLKRAILEKKEIIEVILRQILTQTSSEYGTRFTHLWMGLYRRDFVLGHNITFRSFISIDDDLIFLIDVISYAEKIGLIPETGYLWLQNYSSESHTSQYTEDFVRKTTEHFEYYREVAKRTVCSEDLRRAVAGFIPQGIIADSLVNWADMPEGPARDFEKKSILKLLNSEEYSNVWEENYLGSGRPGGKTYELLKNGSFEAAFAYNQKERNLRVLRRKLRSIWDRIH